MWQHLPFHQSEPVSSEMAKTTPVTPVLKVGTVYEDWKLEVGAWQELTELPKMKQGLMLTMAISDNHPMGLKHKVLGPSVGMDNLKKEQGVAKLFEYLDGILLQDKFVDLYNTYKKFENFKREKSDSIEQYISSYDAIILELKKKKIEYPNVVKAFKLLEGSRVSELKKKMIVASVRYEGNEADLYKDMCSSLKKTAGEVNTLGRSASDKRVTVEDVEAMAAEHAEAFAAAGFRKDDGKKGNG